MSNETSRNRDYVILAAVAVLVIVGYFVLRTTPVIPSAQAQQQEQDERRAPHGDMGGAMQDLEFPEDYESLVQMGNHYMDQQDYAVAAESYRRALAIQEATDVRVDFGTCLHGMGLSERALQEFRKVLRVQPEHGIANFNMAVVSYSVGQADSARHYANRYLELEPDGRAAPTAREILEVLDTGS